MCADVRRFQDAFGRAAFGGREHGTADLFCREDVVREKPARHGEKRFGDRVKNAVARGFGLNAVERLDDAWAKQ